MVSADQIAVRSILPPGRIPRLRIWLTRAGILGTIAALWEILAHSRVLFEDVVPPLCVILPAMGTLLTSADFYRHLGVSAAEIAAGTCVGGLAGLAVGVAIGISRFRIRAFEPHLRYLAPTPKIIFFPVMIMWFGIGFGSKIAMGAFAAFFPVALSVVAGMRGIDEVLINVGKSFGATRI